MATPQNDYYEYVNGQWCRETPIPADQARWGSFNVLAEENKILQRKLCESDTGLIGKLYKNALTPPTTVSDTVSRLFNEVRENVIDVPSYLRMAGKLFTCGVGSLFHMCKSPDDKEPGTNVPQIFQSGLGLPDMSYYTDRKDLHEPYKTFLTKLCSLYGETIDSSAVFDFEASKALLHLTRVECRDPNATYNRMDATEVHAYLPEYFEALALPPMTYYIVQNPKLLVGLRKVLESMEVKTLREHLIICIALNFASLGPDTIANERFDFYGRLLNGQKERQARWKEALATVRQYLRDELGKLYVATYYPPEASAKCRSMIQDLIVALEQTIKESPWMAEATRAQALDKLARFGVKVGAPDEVVGVEGLWTGLDVAVTDLSTLALEWAKWDWREQECAKFYTPVNRRLWEMGAFEVNAYFHPTMNEIVFPAGILQRPFFGFDTYEENLGAIGVVIGHEMTHGYDDSGSEYNQFGELKQWWSDEDRAEFTERARTVEEHYGSLLFMGKPVNGKLTLGENIADIGGLKLALHALQSHYAGKSTDEMRPIYDRFFRAYATLWRMNITESCAHQMLVTDPHSPGFWRVNAALAHIPEFVETYGVMEGHGMYLAPEKRMSIW